MKPIVTAVVLIAGLFVVSKFVAGKAVSRFRFALSSIGVTFAGLVPVLTLNISVKNPTDTTVTINRVAGDIYVNGEFVARASSIAPASIAALGETLYKLNVELNINAIVRELLDVLRGALSRALLIRVDGEATIEGVTIPFDVTHSVIPENLIR